MLVEASLCLEAAKRPQWPRVYLLGRPRSCGHMPSLIGDSGQVLGVLGWALTRIHNLPLGCNAVDMVCQPWLCVEQSCESFTDISGRGGASNVCCHS